MAARKPTSIETVVILGQAGTVYGIPVVNPDGTSIGSSSGGGLVEYNATPPTLSDGGTDSPQSDINGNTKVVEQYASVAEDNVNGKIVVEQRYTPFTISTATTTTVKSGSGYVDEIIVVGGTLGNVTIYDNTAASGTVLLPTVTPVANGVLLRHITFGTGLTIVTASATVIVGGYR